MSLQIRLAELISAIGADVKDLKTNGTKPLVVQALKGNGLGGLVTATSVTTLKYHKSNANLDMEIVYTPTQDVWWEVSVTVGYMEKTDTGNADCFLQLTISPDDEIAAADTEAQNSTVYANVTQSSTADPRVFRSANALWALKKNVTYTARVFPSFSSGAWRYAVGYNSMYGKAYAR